MKGNFRSARSAPAVATASLLMLAGCSNGSMPLAYCTAPRSLAVEVTVTDSVSGLPLAQGASGLLHNSARTDTLYQVQGSALVMAGGSHLGTYSIDLSRAGYAGWHRGGIVVDQTGSCGNVMPVQLQARLAPVS